MSKLIKPKHDARAAQAAVAWGNRQRMRAAESPSEPSNTPVVRPLFSLGQTRQQAERAQHAQHQRKAAEARQRSAEIDRRLHRERVEAGRIRVEGMSRKDLRAYVRAAENGSGSDPGNVARAQQRLFEGKKS